MKASTCFTALALGAFAIATPTSNPDIVPAVVVRAPKTTEKPSEYGFFKFPVIPSLPEIKLPFDISPWDGNSTLLDYVRNLLTPHGPEHRGNWIPGYGINTDYDEKWPPFGKTVRATFTITNTTLSPTGTPKQMLVVNGQFPGPKIEANWGDWIEITVVNGMKYNGTSMHWHGFRQLKNNLADGPGGATECPLAPGESRTYRFQATQYGTTWYHSHFSTQLGDGVVGPIVINGPSSANYDIDLGHVLVSDWYRGTAPQEDWIAHRKGPPPAINYLINGQNVAVDGSTGKRATFKFTPGKKHLLRLVNTALDSQFKFSIDGHTLKVIQADFVPIVPYNTNELNIQIGQRYHVIVEANQPAGNYWFRAMAALDCTQNANTGAGTANAIISYTNAPNTSALPTSTATNHTNTCVDEPIGSLVPIVTKAVDSANFVSTVKTEAVDIQVIFNPEFVFQWTLGGVSQVLDWTKPLIQDAVAGTVGGAYNSSRNVRILDKPNVWTYWVIQNKFFVPHPLHLHGHDFSLLGQGIGTFNPATDVDKLNFKNPARRDVALLAASGWTVIAFKTDNPGAWLMHCHIAWHSGEGLSLAFIERPADIPALYKSQVQGSEFTNSCKKFTDYQKTATWPQYDSGLKKRMANGVEYVNWSASKVIKMKERMYSRREGNVVRKTI